jgi:hypothetical protein
MRSATGRQPKVGTGEEIFGRQKLVVWNIQAATVERSPIRERAELSRRAPTKHGGGPLRRRMKHNPSDDASQLGRAPSRAASG